MQCAHKYKVLYVGNYWPHKFNSIDGMHFIEICIKRGLERVVG